LQRERERERERKGERERERERETGGEPRFGTWAELVKKEEYEGGRDGGEGEVESARDGGREIWQIGSKLDRFGLL
jgi:hypothetical protein